MQPSFIEKRTIARSRVFFGAEVRTRPDRPAVECHVKSVSEKGARIVLQNDDLLPDQFELYVRKTNERRHAVVTWSRGREFGVVYRLASSPRPWSSPPALRQMMGRRGA